jgi:site-specific DNA-methyltransferase (adenine-specific)
MVSPGTKYLDSESSAQALTTFAGDNRDQRGYGYWMALWLGEALRVLKPGAVIALFTDWRQLPTTTDQIQAGGFVWRGLVPWVKPSTRPQAGRFAAQCEYIVWGSAGPMPVDYTVPALPGFYEAMAPRDRIHMTQKPLSVLRGLVRVAAEGGIVLDPFMGSGTTGVAAVIERRGFIGIEIVPEIARAAEGRILEARGLAVEKNGQLTITAGEVLPTV